ncbi:hypothetical protein BOTBODRAFT_184381 [Botryobasidium botryosum FD-172 SS1]|uniref:Uncharacterized protein n=1 Tax=Botryobasidium botryosum (strain FD-172 SS1) TaxID=930990 RepID=A0A067MXE2_BOTB1|nr:hypothetical protein BOTBODRAFT_184381 [Botryobasidium botryosum FD-172 SS1]
MGTPGLKVYRHRARYFIHHNQYDSYPEEFGINILSEIPLDDEFEEWLAFMREQLDRELELWEASGHLCEKDQAGLCSWIMEDQPKCWDWGAEWVYELDLDRLVFLIDAHPMFRLDRMPPKDIFVQGIGFDHYGARACTPTVPEEYRYDWMAAPIFVEDSVLDEYRSYARGPTAVVPIRELLEITEGLSHAETVWTRLLEFTIGQLMRRFSPTYKEIESRASWTELTMVERALSLTAINAAFQAPLDFEDTEEKPPEVPEENIWWARDDVCVSVATHLDDEQSMHAAIVRLREDAMRERACAPDVVYGVVTSVYHLVIVRVDKPAGGAVRHTPALQFFPSSYAMSPSTPGITALARLGRRVQPPIKDVASLLDPDDPLSNPLGDMLRKLAKHATSNPEFACLSNATPSAVELLLKYPLLAGEFPLLSVIPNEPQNPGGGGQPHPHLISGNFATVVDGKPATIHLARPSGHGHDDATLALALNCFKSLPYYDRQTIIHAHARYIQH